MYVEIPEVGTVVEQGEQLSVLESVKAVADVNAVVSGKVTGVNSALENSPSLINEQPFGDGTKTKCVRPLSLPLFHFYPRRMAGQTRAR